MKKIEPPKVLYQASPENFHWLIDLQAKYREQKKRFGMSRLINLIINKLRNGEKENIV